MEYDYSDAYYIRRGVLAQYSDVQVVLISEIFHDTNSLVFSAYEPELRYFLFKIKTPTGKNYVKHDSNGTGLLRISIPSRQIDHVCRQMEKKEIKYVVLDYDREPGANHMKHKITRSNICNIEGNPHRF